ncbi:hypothetical protein LN042_23995 [Kitasatospora sp. RB6PN24]|uniref:hypothetical protein n=1 Tax=Kitasatospora humi TaxID=2893891 RepID=UPI001E32899E|nr:hypothetical protein [Kitasatospora humi]MCC9310092.1 hypothetical protein [Kitasatospora humi]
MTTDQTDLAVLRAAAHREIENLAGRQLPRAWCLVRLSDQIGIAPTCPTEHAGRSPIHPTVSGLFGCCPQPWIRVGYPAVAQLLLALLNPSETPTLPDPISDDPTGAWT